MAKLILPERQKRKGAGENSEPHTLLISIAHGDLRLAKYPLAVGHYHGDTIVHAEKRLDDQLEGRLTELFNLYLYPGPVETAEVIHVPDAKPPGALIIGLGDVGEIRPSIVRNGVANAVLRNALAVLNEKRNNTGKPLTSAPHSNGESSGNREWVSAGFSTLLLGTYGGNALSIQASLSAIVQGVIRANEALRFQGLWQKVRVDEVQIVELYEDMALEAARAASYLAAHPPVNLPDADKLKVEPSYIRPLGNGRFQRPFDPYSAGWWRRIRITSEKDKDGREGLRFLALTDRARAEDTLQYTQREFIDELVQRAVASTDDASALANVLFKLLIPNSLKDQARAENDLVLVVDNGAAQYPWELLAERTRDGIEPLATRMGLIRQFQTPNFVRNPQPARERTALVIGAPKSNEAPLPGAEEEASLVAELLKKADYDIGEKPLIGAGSVEVLNQLFAKGYKILHLAGHGKYVKDNPGESGMILDVGCLSSITLRNLSPLPALVFINCCHLGTLDRETSPLTTGKPHALAASISEELINMGVKAVVAAGWAINDAAAAAFAATFYTEMLRGTKFGMAVKAAREAAYKKASTSNTWGAYQCYGNPDFVLERSGDSSESASPPDNNCYSQREYLERLADIQSDATRAAAKGREELCRQLEELDAALPPIWRDGAVLSAFGAAWKALGAYKRAIQSYRETVGEEKAAAPFNTIEQLANLLAVCAEKSHLTPDPAAGVSPEQLIDEAISRLKWLLELSESSERLSLLAGCYKRKARIEPTWSAKRKCLKSASYYYEKAHLFFQKKTGNVLAYPALNWLMYRLLLGDALRRDVKLIDESIAAAAKAEEIEPSFWNRVTKPDAELLRHLALGDLEEQLPRITVLYQKTFGTGAKQRDRDAVVDQWGFLIEMLSASDPKSGIAAKNLESLRKLQAAFEGAD